MMLNERYVTFMTMWLLCFIIEDNLECSPAERGWWQTVTAGHGLPRAHLGHVELLQLLTED